MKSFLFHGRLATLNHHRNLLLTGCGVLSVICTLESIALIFKRETVIIMPPEISQSFWIEKGRASAAYLEEMSVFLVNLILDNSPSSAAYQRDVILRYVLPESYGAFKSQLITDENRLKKENLSTSFKPVSIKVSRRQNLVHLTGDLFGFIGDKRIFQTRKCYALQLTFSYGRLFIKSFTELKENNHEL